MMNVRLNFNGDYVKQCLFLYVFNIYL